MTYVSILGGKKIEEIGLEEPKAIQPTGATQQGGYVSILSPKRKNQLLAQQQTQLEEISEEKPSLLDRIKGKTATDVIHKMGEIVTTTPGIKQLGQFGHGLEKVGGFVMEKVIPAVPKFVGEKVGAGVGATIGLFALGTPLTRTSDKKVKERALQAVIDTSELGGRLGEQAGAAVPLAIPLLGQAYYQPVMAGELLAGFAIPAYKGIKTATEEGKTWKEGAEEAAVTLFGQKIMGAYQTAYGEPPTNEEVMALMQNPGVVTAAAGQLFVEALFAKEILKHVFKNVKSKIAPDKTKKVLAELKKQQEIVDQIKLDPAGVKRGLTDVGSKVNKILTGDSTKATPLGNKIKGLDLGKIDSPGQFYQKVSAVLRADPSFKPEMLNFKAGLAGTTNDFFRGTREGQGLSREPYYVKAPSEFPKSPLAQEVIPPLKLPTTDVPKFNAEFKPADFKVPTRTKPTAIENFGTTKINVKDKPNVYTDGNLLLLDRKLAEVKKWQAEAKKIVTEKTIDYKAIEELLPTKETALPLKEPLAYTKGIGQKSAYFDVGAESPIALNAEAYQWLRRQGYSLEYQPDFQPIILKRNNKLAGLLMREQTEVSLPQIKQAIETSGVKPVDTAVGEIGEQLKGGRVQLGEMTLNKPSFLAERWYEKIFTSLLEKRFMKKYNTRELTEKDLSDFERLYEGLTPMREVASGNPIAEGVARQGRRMVLKVETESRPLIEQLKTQGKQFNEETLAKITNLLEMGLTKADVAKIPDPKIREALNTLYEWNVWSRKMMKDLGYDVEKFAPTERNYLHHTWFGNWAVREVGVTKTPSGKEVPTSKTVAIGKLNEVLKRYSVEMAKNPNRQDLVIEPRFQRKQFSTTLLSRKGFWNFVNKSAKSLEMNRDDVLELMQGVGAISPRGKWLSAGQRRLSNLDGYVKDPFLVNQILTRQLIFKKNADAYNKWASEELVKLPRNLKESMSNYVDALVKPEYGGSTMNRAINKWRGIQANLKLGYRATTALVNRLQAVQMTAQEIGLNYLRKGYRFKKTVEGKKLLEESGVEKELPKTEVKPTKKTIWEWIKPLGWFTKSERGVRGDVYAGGYLYAKEVLKFSEPKAKEYAMDLVDTTALRYDISDMPSFARKAAGKLIMQFRLFPIGYLINLKNILSGRPLAGMEKYYREVPLTPAQKTTRAVKFLGINFALGGLRALPMAARVGVLSYLVLNYPRVTRGIWGFLGIDLSNQMGVSIGELFPKDLVDLLGVNASDINKLYQFIDTGDPKFLAGIIPTAYRIYQALDADDGYLKTPYQDEKPVVKLSPLELTLYGIGFEPVKLSQLREAHMLLDIKEEAREEQVKKVFEALVKKDLDKAQEEATEAFKEGYKISSQSLINYIRGHQETSIMRRLRSYPRDILIDLFKDPQIVDVILQLTE